MKRSFSFELSSPSLRRILALGVTIAVTLGLTACATSPYGGTYTTERDNTRRGAAIGAAVGVAGALAKGKREADELLAGAAIGAVVGGGVGAYMDAQEERLARIPGTSVERAGEDTLLVRFESDILFPVDSANLSPSARGSLDQVAGVLLDFPKTAVVVHGHTDSTGSESHNLQLSERRANSVSSTLISRGVDPRRVSAIGSGESLPVASNDSDWGRQQNRRVEILLRAQAT